jgi:hypothetical protein
MSWPFSNVTAPNVDSGLASPGAAGVNTFGAIPNSPAGTQWALGFWFANTTADAVTVSVKDANGVTVIPVTAIPGGVAMPFEVPFMPLTGPLQWQCSLTSGVNAKYWGYA